MFKELFLLGLTQNQLGLTQTQLKSPSVVFA